MADKNSPFTIHNLPYGIISSVNNPEPRCATAYDRWAVDLVVLWQGALFDGIAEVNERTFNQPHLNAFAALPRDVRLEVRARLKSLISSTDVAQLSANAAFLPLDSVQMHFPMDTRNFSDFYCSLEHTKNCTALFSPNPINPNWFTIPSVYNGRTSSLVISGTPVTRPMGVFPSAGADGSKAPPTFQPETHLDFELEMGVFLSKPVPRGQRLQTEDAKESIFGLVMLNDWSARSIQFYEMAPLGPFHAKGSATTISPWIVPLEALEAVACARHTEQEPAPPAHLSWHDAEKASFNIEVSVKLIRDGKTYTLGTSNLNELHWTPFQQLVHLGSAGEGLSTGDLFGTGTISSARTNQSGEKSGLGCLYERKLAGNALSSAPADLVETFLEDGDEVILEGWAVKPGTDEILFGFAESRGKVLQAV